MSIKKEKGKKSDTEASSDKNKSSNKERIQKI